MKLFFIITLILSLGILGVCWYMTSGKKSEKYSSALKGACVGITCYEAILGFTEMLGFFSYYGLFQFLGTASVTALLLMLLYQKKPGRTVTFAVRMVMLASVLELTLFNIPSYRVFFGGYEQRTYLPSDGILESEHAQIDENGNAVSPDRDWIILAFENVDTPIRTLAVNVTFSNEKKGECRLVVDAKDASQRGDYRYDIGNDKVIAQEPKSSYMTLDLSGSVSDMRVKLLSIADGTVDLHSVTINAMIPFEIYYPRFWFLVLAVTFVYAVMHSTFLKQSFAQTEKFCRIFTLVTAAVCCIATFSILDYKLGETSWSDKINYEGGNQVSRELVLAFEQGHVYLDAVPNEQLLAMEDPYERWMRDITAPYEWDHVLYNGKYYSYYGIAPVILLFLPFHKITGHFCPNELAVLIFSFIGFFGLAFVLLTFVKKWFPGVRTGVYLASMLMLYLNCGIWFSVGRPDFYEVAMASGFAFMSWGVYFLLSANILGKGRISLPRTLVTSLLMAIAVLCRPTLVLYCICAGAFLLFNTKRASVSKEDETPKLGNRRSILYLVCAFVPMVSIGLVQMWYNYARFDSPFEFGIQYSLTINNFTKTEFHPALSWVAIYNYLFNPPVLSMEYPQISTTFQNMRVNGFFYQDLATGNTSGLFWLMPPLLAYLFCGKALRKLPDRKSKLITSVCIAVPCVLIPVGIIASVWESGYAARYMSDFAWQMTLGAYAIIFFLDSGLQDDTKKKGIQLFFSGSFIWTMIVSGVQIFDFIFRYAPYHYDEPGMQYMVDRLFTFWR